MSDRHKSSYDKGYEEGKKSDIMDSFVQNISTGFGAKDSYEKSYNKGFSDGAKDKYDSDNSNYSGGCSSDSGGSGGICFVTTACIKSKGLPDNCMELETLRRFRQNYVLNLPNGSELNEEYKKIAPIIVSSIDELSDSKVIYDKLYLDILSIVNNINIGNNETALNEYLFMVRSLSDKFNIR